MSNIQPTPDYPEDFRSRFAFVDAAVKPATPDLITIKEEDLPIDIITQLLFEDIGSIEVLNIARTDIINGRNITYGIIPRLSDLARRHSPVNIFNVSGTLSEFFNNFAIKLRVHIPEEGSGPDKAYVGEETTFGCSGFPVLEYKTDEVLGCFNTLAEAQDFARNIDFKRDAIYSEPNTGNIVVDVINLKKDYQVEIELLVSGSLENDTIY